MCFWSCQPKLQPEKPKNLIPKDKMVDVLHDIFIVSSAKGMGRTKFERAGINPEQYILDKYSIDSLQFAKSTNYYAYDIETYKTIIEEVKTRLSEEKEYFSKIEKEEQEQKKRERDSLRKLREEDIQSLPLKKKKDT